MTITHGGRAFHMPLTCTGTGLSVVVPSPSWPSMFQPQHHTVPSVFSAHVWPRPSETVAQSVVCPLTWTGTGLWVVVPSPSLPKPLSPQHHVVRSVLTPRACAQPAETVAQSVVCPLTWTGTGL